jgi:imidazolonepropionase-like amidohydrolase
MSQIRGRLNHFEPLMLLNLTLALALAADTITYPVLNHGRPAGEMRVVRDADSVVVTYAHIDRQRGRWLQTRYTMGTNGAVSGGESRPMTREMVVSAANDRYRVVGDSVVFARGTAAERRVARGNGFYALGNSTPYDLALQVKHLLAQPGMRAPSLPLTGLARLELAADTTLRGTRGNVRLRLAMVHGVGNTPRAVWVDANGDFAAGAVEWFIALREDLIPAMPAMRAIEVAYRERAAVALAARVKPANEGVVVIRNADVFDSERGVILPQHSIVMENGRITSVAPTRGFREPRGASVIDATGKTVIPGMWDMHSHVFLTTQNDAAFRNLAIGVTTIRDMAADTDIATSLMRRANDGSILAPYTILGGFIEGPLLWSGPSDVLVHTEAQAREWVNRYADLGYKQIKLYNYVHPDIVPTIVAEARKRGLRVSGHIPRGLSVSAAIGLGFDEVNHAAFLFSTHFQDSLYVPTMRAYSGVAQIVAPNFDVDGAAMTTLINDLKAHNTVVDGTFNLWLRDSTAADSVDAKRNNRAYLRLIKRLYDAGVTLVAGTDGSSFNRELEHYEMAGIPAPQVLQIATLTSARVMGLAATQGKIAAGYTADLVIINGKPHERIEDLRRVELVVRGGKAYTPASLLQAVNTSAFP